MAALVKRYRAPEWALLEQVGNGTGFAGNRWADAMAMSLWPSRGLDLHGFEIKVSRYDWQRELRNPSKAEDIATYCDFWWIVVGGPNVAEIDELPAPWGLMELTGRGLMTRKAAVRRPEAATLDRPLVAAILRRASEGTVPKQAIKGEIEAAREDGEKRGRDAAIREREHAGQDHERMARMIADFEAASGVKIQSYAGGLQGRAFKLALGLGEDGLLARARHNIDSLKRVAGELEALTSPGATHD